jgi:hypothetical protein
MRNLAKFVWLSLVLTGASAIAQTMAPTDGTKNTIAADRLNPAVGNTVGMINDPDASSLSTICAEAFMTSAMNGDYGQAINAAVAAQPLKMPSKISICSQGDHPVSTPIVFDRPVHFDMTGSKLIPQPGVGSIPVSIPNATMTANSTTIAIPNTHDLSVGQRLGGTGIFYGTVITSIGSGSITVSKAPAIVLTGFITSGSTVVSGLSSLNGVVAGQGVSGYGIPDNATISSINYNNQSIVISSAATRTATLHGLQIPASVTLSGSWTAPLQAVSVTPVITWSWNANALHNEYDQMIGGSMHGVWITDTTNRGIDGIQGVKIVGWDRFSSYDTTIEQIAGSGFILQGWCVSASTCGRMDSVRESFFYNTKIRYTGTETTGQSALEIMSGPHRAGGGGDENNQLGFVGGQLVSDFGESVLIGTYNVNHIKNNNDNNGPRLIWFADNFQIELGDYISSHTSTQFDVVHIMNAGDIYFTGAEIAGSGYGKSTFRIDNAASLSVTNSKITNLALGSQPYPVSVASGSPTIKWEGGAVGTWVTSGSWNGIAAEVVDGKTCTTASPCIVYLSPANAVPDNRTLTLAAGYPGASNSSATLTIPYPGYVFNITHYLFSLFVNDDYLLPYTFNGILGMGTDQQQLTYVGYGFVATPPLGEQQSWDGSIYIPKLSAGGWDTVLNSNKVPQVTNPTAGHVACIKSAGPPVVIGYCSSVNSSTGKCNCN